MSIEFITEDMFGKGGVIAPRDERVASFSEIVADSPTFDWVKGFDIRTKIGKDISLKNQNGSGSCGGQASAYLVEAISLVNKLNDQEFSARSIYNKCYVPQGGSSESGLMNVITNIGVDLESVTTSYENGNPPSEEFMRTPDSNPSFIKGLRPVYVDVYSFDDLATAVLQNNGIIIGISGQNNGTWLLSDPTLPDVPNSDSSLWRHWVYVGYAGIRNGKKMIGFKNSWGIVGENGWQFIGEEWLPYIWAAWSMTYVPSTKPKYTFLRPMVYGQSSKDIKALQDILRYEGFFKTPSTGYYGPITASAVYKFQVKYNAASIQELNLLQGKRVGPKTLAILNKLYG